MASISIYVAMHKPYQVAQENMYIPIHVGAAGKKSFCECRDDTGDNISDKNKSYCEITALYWIWKNSESDVVGLVHYRRYFAGASLKKDPWQKILSSEKALKMLDSKDILLPRKHYYIIETTYSHYAHAHHGKDMRLTRKVIEEMHPDYCAAFDKVMKQRSGHRLNMFITRKETMDEYCSWLFPMLTEIEKRIDTTDYDAYNKRVIGFITERLLDVWLRKNELRYKELPIVNIEKVDWIKKGIALCKRKLTRRQS